MFKCSGARIQPEATARGKFSNKGLVTASAFLSKVKNVKTAEALASKANFGLTANTHKTYQTSINHVKKCEEETGVSMALPFNESRTLEFLGWMEARGLKSRSMSSYLSGVRAYHIAMGFEDPFMRNPMVKLILKGQDNWDKLKEKMEGKRGKLPMTISMMKLLKKKLLNVNWPIEEKRLFWAVATLAWSGSFRIHELLSKKEVEFDTQTTLLWRNVKVGSVVVHKESLKVLTIHIKSPKIDRIGAGDNIEVFQLDNFMCPVKAMESYRQVSKVKGEPEMPVFRLNSGECLTGKGMNRRLDNLTQGLEKLVPGGVVKSHSFRAGVASEMARRGHNSEDIKGVGRWSSEAYLAYVKLPQTRRAEMARTIGRE